MESPLFPWSVLCATALIAFTFFGFTLTSAVPVWIDESFIVEYGRVTLAGNADVFAFHQRSDANRPMYLYTVLGSAIQELAYRATEPSNLGPRISALLGQLAAFGYLLYYFRLRGVNDRFSLLLGLAFLIDPLCDIGWRGGRVDSWAFAFLFASLCGIRIASRWSVFWGGVAAAAGFQTWPSFAMLSPLIVLELITVVRQQRLFIWPIGMFAAGGTIATAAVVAPFYRQFGYGLADAALLTSIQSQMNRTQDIGHNCGRWAFLLRRLPSSSWRGYAPWRGGATYFCSPDSWWRWRSHSAQICTGFAFYIYCPTSMSRPVHSFGIRMKGCRIFPGSEPDCGPSDSCSSPGPDSPWRAQPCRDSPTDLARIRWT